MFDRKIMWTINRACLEMSANCSPVARHSPESGSMTFAVCNDLEKVIVMKYVAIAVSVLVVIIVAFATIKKVSPVGWGLWGTTNTSSGVMLHGHDPVG